jgi:hypothetical protein
MAMRGLFLYTRFNTQGDPNTTIRQRLRNHIVFPLDIWVALVAWGVDRNHVSLLKGWGCHTFWGASPQLNVLMLHLPGSIGP